MNASGALADKVRVQHALIRDFALILGYATCVGLSALAVIHLPFTPVPITGQTFAVLAGAMAIGWQRSILGMLVYCALGLAGVPWFAGGVGGPVCALAPSFGYIVGFAAASAVVGWLGGRGFDRKPQLVLAAVAVGSVVIYIFGASWLAVSLHLSLASAVALGVTPFLLGDAMKALLAAGVLPAANLVVK